MDNSSLSPSSESSRGSGLRGLGRILASPFSRSRHKSQIRVISTSPENPRQTNPGGKTLNYRTNKGSKGSGVYIDVENLQEDAQTLISSLMHNWPEAAPTPSRMTLYVRADQAELWRLWTVDQFGGVQVIVKGIQHFSRDSSKNSADIAIATNAIADFVRGRIAHIVVFSDDSDFISLYGAIRDEVDGSRDPIPFLWAVTDRHKSLSANVKQFFPRNLLHVVSADSRSRRAHPPLRTRPGVSRRPTRPVSTPSPQPSISQAPPTPPPLAPAPLAAQGNSWADMARTIVRERPLGAFKSTDCQDIIRRRWPGHRLARVGGAAFGTEFKKSIWPELEKLSVKIPNPNRKPVTYELTNEAKAAVR